MSASENSDFGDIENELECYLIRKKLETIGEDKTTTRINSVGIKPIENVPLMLGELQNVTFDPKNPNVFRIKLGSKELLFRSCISHVVIMGQGPKNEKFCKYIVDDGTGIMPLSIYRHAEKMRQISRMQNENRLIAMQNSLQKKKELTDSLHRLLAKAADNLDASNLPLGSRLLIQGRPQSFKGKLEYAAFCFSKDQGVSRKIEIAFKDYMLHWYSKHSGIVTALS